MQRWRLHQSMLHRLKGNMDGGSTVWDLFGLMEILVRSQGKPGLWHTFSSFYWRLKTLFFNARTLKGWGALMKYWTTSLFILLFYWKTPEKSFWRWNVTRGGRKCSWEHHLVLDFGNYGCGPFSRHIELTRPSAEAWHQTHLTLKQEVSCVSAQGINQRRGNFTSST